jgi:hypothetical protein
VYVSSVVYTVCQTIVNFHRSYTTHSSFTFFFIQYKHLDTFYQDAHLHRFVPGTTQKRTNGKRKRKAGIITRWSPFTHYKHCKSFVYMFWDLFTFVHATATGFGKRFQTDRRLSIILREIGRIVFFFVKLSRMVCSVQLRNHL